MHLWGQPNAFLAQGARQIDHVLVCLYCQSNLAWNNGCTNDNLTGGEGGDAARAAAADGLLRVLGHRGERLEGSRGR